MSEIQLFGFGRFDDLAGRSSYVGESAPKFVGSFFWLKNKKTPFIDPDSQAFLIDNIPLGTKIREYSF